MYLDFSYRITDTRRTATTDDLRVHVRNLVETVLFTAPGERVMRPEFGSGLSEMIFDTNNEALETATEFMIRSALQQHLENLITVDALSLTRDGGTLIISLSYTIRQTEEQIAETFREGVAL